MPPRRILIAGITGFLGSRLAHEFVRHGGTSVLGLYRKNSNLNRIDKIRSEIELFNLDDRNLEILFRTHQIDIIINCIADYGRNTSLAEASQANVQLPSLLLELGLGHRVSLFLNAGTSLPAEVNNYSLTKNQFSDHLRTHASKLIAIDAKLEHFYGPSESEERFIGFLITQFLKPAANLDLTKGEQLRDFLHVDDVVSALYTLIKNGIGWQPGYYEVPVGSGEAYVLRNVVELIRRFTQNTETKINYGAVPYRETEVMVSRANTGILNNLGWKPRYGLEEGLRRTIEGSIRSQGRNAL